MEVSAEHLGVEPDLGSQPILVDAVFGVGPQFMAGVYVRDQLGLCANENR